jgi:ribosome biogenesis GTPase A
MSGAAWSGKQKKKYLQEKRERRAAAQAAAWVGGWGDAVHAPGAEEHPNPNPNPNPNPTRILRADAHRVDDLSRLGYRLTSFTVAERDKHRTHVVPLVGTPMMSTTSTVTTGDGDGGSGGSGGGGDIPIDKGGGAWTADALRPLRRPPDEMMIPVTTNSITYGDTNSATSTSTSTWSWTSTASTPTTRPVPPPGTRDRTGTPSSSNLMHLPRVRRSEVGFTAQGLRLGMPRRPDWRGRNWNAAQLHTAEETIFRRWLDHLATFGATRISHFEGNLEYWRQLWRVLDRSHVVLIVVDARCPLLHFPDALYRWACVERQMPVVLHLNKADLVPEPLLVAWQGWFAKHYPGLRCVWAQSGGLARDGSRVRRREEQEVLAQTAATVILDAVLDMELKHEKVRVRDVVGSGVEALIAASRARNRPDQGRGREEEAAARGNIPVTDAEATANGGGEESDGNRGTSTDQRVCRTGRGRGKGKEKGREYVGGLKYAALRQAESLLAEKDMINDHVSDEGENGDDDWDLRGRKARKKQAEKGKRHARMVGAMVRGGPSGRGGAGIQYTRADNTEGEYIEDDPGYKRNRGRKDEDTGGADPDAGTETDEAPGDVDAQARIDFEAMEDRDSPHHETTVCVSPVVLAVVGEPNVGKSSTINALLGAHRVAVSSQPGKTKHYQTHYMTSHLMLCDCPGLVFPKLDVSLPIQVLFGSVRIAGVRQPFPVVRFLAERHVPDLVERLGLRRVPAEESSLPPIEDWSPAHLCEAVAARFGWRYKKGAVLDVLRAANWLMRSALAGRNGVRLALAPPLEEEEGEAKREEGEDVGQGFLPKGDEDTIWRARFGY